VPRLMDFAAQRATPRYRDRIMRCHRAPNAANAPVVRLRQAGRAGRTGRAAPASGDRGTRAHSRAFARIGRLLGAKVARLELGLSAEGSIAEAETSATRGTRIGPRARLIYYRQQDLVQAKW
jgi:hypothetical protein